MSESVAFRPRSAITTWRFYLTFGLILGYVGGFLTAIVFGLLHV